MIATVLQNFGAACASKGVPILPPWYKYIDGTTDATGHCTLNFTFPEDMGLVGLAVFEILLRLAALIAVGYIIYGGINYMISQGEPDKVNGAKQTVINALVGLVIAMLSSAIVAFFGSRFLT